MAVIEEISDSEAAEILGSKSSQNREADRDGGGETAGDSVRDGAPSSNKSELDEVLRRISDLEQVLPASEDDEGDSRSDRPNAEREIRAETSADAETDSKGKKPGAGEAVLLGALATGVNSPTWFVIKAVLVALAASLVLLLHVAIQSSSWMVILNVSFLIIIAGGLALLLSWYISQVGLVSVEKQMAELNLADEPSETGTKKTE